MNHEKSAAYFAEARKFIPGGVNSANRVVEPSIFFRKSKGSKIWDVDGNEYIDYHAGFGPPILGHNNENVNNFVKGVMQDVDLIGIGAIELETKTAEKIVRHVSSVEKVLFCNAGSEATYHAIRLARAHTQRNKIIKFQGCYHGWHDAVLTNVISPPGKLGKPDPGSAGMAPHSLEDTIVVDFNNLEQVENAVRSNKGEVAAIILELIPHNIGCVLPKLDFVKGLREIADRENVALIFDEVITGFRHDIGGYQRILGVKPDLTTFGKAMANGYPIAALGGREDMMRRLGPGGDVFFAGTFNGHPFSVAACFATISELEKGQVHKHIFKLGDIMREGMKSISEELRIKTFVTGFGSIFITYFMEAPVESYTDLLRNDKEFFVEYRRRMIEKGIYMLPVNLKRNHISAAHTEKEVRLTLEKAREVLGELVKTKQNALLVHH